MMVPQFAELCEKLQVNVVGYDYTGYGPSDTVSSPSDRRPVASDWQPSVELTYENVADVYDWIVNESGLLHRGIPARELIVYGQSVGSGPSCKLATDPKRPICGLILHSPIMSGARVITETRGPLACVDIYPNISRVQKVRCPVLVMHGEDDQEVPVMHGRGIHDNIPELYRTPALFIAGAGHNDIVETFPIVYYKRLKDFLLYIENVFVGSRLAVMVTSGKGSSGRQTHSSLASGGGNEDTVDRSSEAKGERVMLL